MSAVDASGTFQYGYLKVAKMVMDSNSTLVVDTSGAVLKSASLTATNFVAGKVNWDNAYDPNPTNDDFYLNFPANPNVTFSSVVVQGTTDLSGAVVMGSLSGPLTTDSLSASTGTVNGTLSGSTGFTIGTLNVAGNLALTGSPNCDISNVGTLVTDSLYFENLSVAHGNVTVDLSGNVSASQKVTVQDNVTLGDLYVGTQTNITQNASISENLSVVQNKYIANIVSVGGPDGSGAFQMWDGSGYADPSGFIVSMTGDQLQALLNLF
jgi:hypothetical protein